MRDYRKLKAFQLADRLALDVYRLTREFPRTEQFGLTNQLRRAVVSVPSNIAEGAARNSHADYVRFLDIAYGSLQEAKYQLSLAHRLGYFKQDSHYTPVEQLAEETSKVLAGLLRAQRSNS